jgi:hypothetical protein
LYIQKQSCSGIIRVYLAGFHDVSDIKTTHPLWLLICALALIIGPAAGGMALAEQSANMQSLANFREDYPFKEYRGMTYKDETVQIDGKNFIDCTFDNVTLRFEGKAPFRFTNDHFTEKFAFASNNPVVKSTMALLGAFYKNGKYRSDSTEPKQTETTLGKQAD